ncbi:MAG: LPS assembly lipoprotein LptE [Verrucomicrobiota bacterium]
MSAWLACAALVAGCAGYQLGPTNGVQAGARSVQVNFLQNKTLEPRLTEAVTSALRKTLQQDGTYRLDTHGDGDIVVTGEITRFDRAGISFQPTDVLTVRDYSLSMTARIKATERATGKVLLESLVSGRTTIRAGSDLASAERQAVPLIADDLAKNATSLLVEGSW